ncbi:hypothetical protein F4553_006778 [Allocatelliglobosispora scoriae]|uniref:Uncharacterized protein n=1 Tax=Allocatelliglobosispora scoriae TaxID=643052 RepID=A0A841BYY2_9ACTN|nr:hypothetical protein [Allocatelliglobosispora scoriae]MBB5873344.1 hypothetical protein [Allocatelliglobosispora scoriae]
MTYPVTGGSFIIGGDGELKDTGYTAVNQPTKKKQDPAVVRGAELKIAFLADNAQAPNQGGGTTMRVSLIQIVQDNTIVTDSNGLVTHHGINGYQPNQIQVFDGTADDGTHIDQQFFNRSGAVINRDPRYAQQRLLGTEKMITQNPKKDGAKVTPEIGGDRSAAIPSGGWAGERVNTKFSLAMLRDQPGATIKTGPNADTLVGGMMFEIAVLFEATNSTPATWGGSISWGFTIVGGQAVLTPIAVIPGGGLSPRFIKARNAWNAAVVGGNPLLQLP